MLSVANRPIMPNGVMLSVVNLNVVAPSAPLILWRQNLSAKLIISMAVSLRWACQLPRTLQFKNIQNHYFCNEPSSGVEVNSTLVNYRCNGGVLPQTTKNTIDCSLAGPASLF
jgi:hypothetical protein